MRDVLPAIRVPTLVIHRSGDRVIPVESAATWPSTSPTRSTSSCRASTTSRSSATSMRSSTRSRSSSPAHDASGSPTACSRPCSSPTSSARPSAPPSSATGAGSSSSTTTIDSSEQSSSASRGKEVRICGDGFLATFDGPARAIRCACAIRDAVRELGIEIRAGLHTGEIELAETGVEGIAVHIGPHRRTRGASEVLVSSTVKDLVVGSGIEFADRGSHVLKGVPGEWHVHAVTDASPGR